MYCITFILMPISIILVQAVCLNMCAVICGKRSAFLCSFLASHSSCSLSVSYTHLDVYKRQIITFMLFSPSYALFRISASTSLTESFVRFPYVSSPSALFIIITGAREQQPRQATLFSVKRPSSVVSRCV